MRSNLKRRDVLRATAATGVAAGAAGCLGSIPLVGGDDRCDAVESYHQAVVVGDSEAAVEHLPYEYVEGADREELIEALDGVGEAGEVEISIDCDCEAELDDEEIDELDTAGLVAGHAITGAVEIGYEYVITLAAEGEELEQDGDDTEIWVEIDDDGWYRWGSEQTFDKC